MVSPIITRRDALVGLSVAAVATQVGGATMAKPGDALDFVAVGDWGRDGASHQRDVANAMGKVAQDVDARFVMSVGDNFYDNGVTSTRDPQWKSSFEDVYTHPGLQCPWYVALGNHDYRGNPQAQIDYATAGARWRMPNRYYRVEGVTLGAPHVDLFCIDTSPLVHSYREKVEGSIRQNVALQDVGAQLAWLDAALANSTAPMKLVFGHHTIFSGGSGHGNTPELVELLRPILERRGVRAYINGHDHDLQHLRVGSVDYICTGAGSEVRPTRAIEGTRFCAARSGFAWLSVREDAVGLTFWDYEGQALYRASLAA